MLYMKSMGNTTGLGPGAEVVVLCRFPVTLSPQSRGSGRRSRPTAGSGNPPAPSPASLSLRRLPSRSLGEGDQQAGATAPSRNLHSTTIPRQTPRRAALYMKSMGNTTGLGPGAGADAPCRFPVTLSPQSRGFRRASRPDQGLWRPATALTHPPSLPPFTGPSARHVRTEESTTGARTPAIRSAARSRPSWQSPYSIPSRSNSRSSPRQCRRTRTESSRWTCAPRWRSIARLEAVPIALTIRPPAPIRIPF